MELVRHNAIGDGSWLWHELVGPPCPPQPADRCDCSSCGGGVDDCPHEGCWQCQGVNAPWCNPNDELKRCEVTVHGTRGAEKYYITEVCPSAHPCNRCKDARLQRCAARAPLAIDVCGMTWAHVFEPTQSEAAGYVTLSCFPGKYDGEAEGGQAALVATPSRDQATLLEAAGRCPVSKVRRVVFSSERERSLPLVQMPRMRVDADGVCRHLACARGGGRSGDRLLVHMRPPA